MLPKIRAGRGEAPSESEPRRKVGEASRFALFGTKQTETVRLRRTASRATALGRAPLPGIPRREQTATN